MSQNGPPRRPGREEEAWQRARGGSRTCLASSRRAGRPAVRRSVTGATAPGCRDDLRRSRHSRRSRARCAAASHRGVASAGSPGAPPDPTAVPGPGSRGSHRVTHARRSCRARLDGSRKRDGAGDPTPGEASGGGARDDRRRVRRGVGSPGNRRSHSAAPGLGAGPRVKAPGPWHDWLPTSCSGAGPPRSLLWRASDDSLENAIATSRSRKARQAGGRAHLPRGRSRGPSPSPPVISGRVGAPMPRSPPARRAATDGRRPPTARVARCRRPVRTPRS